MSLKNWILGALAGVFLLGLFGNAAPDAPAAPAVVGPAPGVEPGARVRLSLNGHEAVFVVVEVGTSGWVRLELDLAWAREAKRLPVVPGLLAESESLLESLDADEVQGLIDRLRGAQDDLEKRRQIAAEALVKETREHPLWVNFKVVDAYVLLGEAEAGADAR